MKHSLRKEIEDMLSLVPDEWELKLLKSRHMVKYPYVYEIRRKYPEGFEKSFAVGYGNTKREALQDLLETWRNGRSLMPMIPAKSKEELKVQFDLLNLEKN